MEISKLEIKNYRNLKNNTFDFGSKINYFYGENAQGKTNLLESIWMFTGARSFRKTKDADLIKFGEEFAKLEGNFLIEKRKQKIEVIFAEGKRKIFLNGIAKKYPTDIIGKFRTVIFTPIHLSLVKDGPDSRRRFIDSAICQLEPSFTKIAINYSQSLRQRNALIRQMIKNQERKSDILEIWDLKLAEIGSKILKSRAKYLSKLCEKAKNNYFEISEFSENLEINYISSITKKNISEMSEEEVKSAFLLKLKESQNSDLKQGFTSAGPHKDDLDITVCKKSLKNFGSQGQQRSAVLALKLAEASVLEENILEPPVILLDDVMSELDPKRQKYIISKLGKAQTFITGCDKRLASYFEKASVFHIKNGGLIKDEK